MSSPPATKRAKKSSDDEENALEQWFRKASTEEVLDRWFPTRGNFDDSRYNMVGDWIGEFAGPTDWNDFEDFLDRLPALAKTKETGISVIFSLLPREQPTRPRLGDAETRQGQPGALARAKI